MIVVVAVFHICQRAFFDKHLICQMAVNFQKRRINLMKKTPLFTFTLLILFTLFSQNTFAQGPSQWHLPEGAKARLGKGTINEIQYSPDGTRLVVAGGIGIWLYDTATHREVALLTGHTGAVVSVAYSPDGDTLASGSWDNTVRLWDVNTEQQKATLTGHTFWVRSVAYSPDGKTIASGSSDATVRLWDAKTGQHKATLTGHTDLVESVAFSPNGDTVASGSWDNTVRLWDANTGQHKATLTGHTGYVWGVAFSPNGNTLASASYDVRLWDAKTGQYKATLTGHTGGVLSVAFSPDGNTLASGNWDNTVRLWDVDTGQQKATLRGHTGAVRSVAFSPDGNTIASGSYGKIRLWDAKTGQHKATITGHTGWGWGVAFSPDGNTIASGNDDSTVRLWDADTGQQKATTRHIGQVYSVAFSPDGNTLASASYDVRLWDAKTGQYKATLTGHTGGVYSVAFSPDGNTLASGSYDSTVWLWDAKTGQHKATLTGHTGAVRSVAFSPDGETLASGGGYGDETVRLWDAKTGQQKDTLTGHTGAVTGLAYSPDGETLASAGGTVRLWDARTGREKATLTERTGSVYSVAYSPDGNTLASGSYDSTVWLWDAETGQHKATLTGHTGAVYSVAFSPDGGLLASGSDDGTVLLWELTPSTIVPSAIAEFLLSVPAGVSLIHVPLKVTTVDGVPKTITSIADLYDALGGASTVNFLITYDAQAKEWRGYFGTPDTGTPADRVLTDDMGVIAALTTRVSVHLDGNPLGTNGKSSITLNQGLNVVGLPLRDTRINRVSDLFTLDGIRGNTPAIILTDGREFKLVGRPGDSGDIEITGGQAFILTAIQAATVPISGEPWTNTSGTATAPPMALTGIQVTDTTPVLGMRGAVVDDGTGLNNPGFRVTVKNISTGRTAAVVTGPDEVDYRLTIVDIETGQAATVGDILEISAHSTNPSIGVQPLRYTVTAEDVKRSLILLPELVAYEIPAETQLLANYPNPFNPETWIPYRLAEDAFVTLTIYDLRGQVVRTLDVGHRVAAVYESRSKAVYWDGRNKVGEQVASGVYFYHLSAGRSGLSVPHRSDYSATRKMLILK